ncbi:MAG: hypothetical protein J0M12_12480, partial [Deltaproteobacteria bacterium]|nr:hypothetical protein [Deltaproteobacteria bacterium]
EMFIKISSRGENDAAGNLYRFDLWDCQSNEVISRESGVVKLSGDYIASNFNLNEGGSYSGTVRGFLKFEEGDITFDNTRDRLATSKGGGGEERRVSEIKVTADNRIISKHRAVRSEEIQKSYSVSSFSGASVADLRFLSGGTLMSFERENGSDTFVGASEFRDAGYASSPDSEEATLVSGFAFDDDSFYAGEIEEPTANLSGISCSPRVDIEMTIDMESDVMGEIRAECEGSRLDGFDMCRSEEIDEAVNNFQQYCSGPPA